MPIPNTLQVLCQGVFRELEGIARSIPAFPDAHRHMLRPVFVTGYLTVTGSSCWMMRLTSFLQSSETLDSRLRGNDDS